MISASTCRPTTRSERIAPSSGTLPGRRVALRGYYEMIKGIVVRHHLFIGTLYYSQWTRNFVDPYSEYGSGSTQSKLRRKWKTTDGRNSLSLILIQDFLRLPLILFNKKKIFLSRDQNWSAFGKRNFRIFVRMRLRKTTTSYPSVYFRIVFKDGNPANLPLEFGNNWTPR